MTPAYMYFQLNGSHVSAAIGRNSEGDVCVGLAFCCPKDKFSKRRGRCIATGRLLKRPQFSFVPDPERRIKEQVFDHLHECLAKNDDRFPAAWR